MLGVSENGYAVEKEVAFMPFYPYAIRYSANTLHYLFSLFNIHANKYSFMLVAAMFISNFSYFTAILALYRCAFFYCFVNFFVFSALNNRFTIYVFCLI